MKTNHYLVSDFRNPANILLLIVTFISVTLLFYFTTTGVPFIKSSLKSDIYMDLITGIDGLCSAAIINAIQHYRKKQIKLVPRALFVQFLAMTFFLFPTELALFYPTPGHPVYTKFHVIVFDIFSEYMLGFVFSFPGLVFGFLLYKILTRLLRLQTPKENDFSI